MLCNHVLSCVYVCLPFPCVCACVCVCLQVAGRRTVPVEVGSHYLAEGWGSQLMTVDEFMATALALRTNDDQGVCVCACVFVQE